MGPILEKRAEGYQHPLYLRSNMFDESIFSAVIEQEEYGYIRFVEEPRVIVDAGANIGMATVFFANRHPNATIYAIEPAADNYEVLCKNIEKYPHVVPICCGLMGTVGKGRILDEGSTLGYQVELNGADSNGVICTTVDAICQQYNISHIDLLKIDIEGAEKEVFSSAEKWLPKVGSIAMELHERYAQDCNRIVFDAIKPYFRYEWIGGENFFFSNEGTAYPIVPDIYKGENPALLPVEAMWELRDYFDRVHTEECAKKDAEQAKLQQALDESSIRFGRMCAEKDAALAGLQQTLDESSERFGRVCAEKDAALAELQRALDESSKQFGRMCTEKDAELAELQQTLDESSKRFGRVCAEKDAALAELQHAVAALQDSQRFSNNTPGKQGFEVENG